MATAPFNIIVGPYEIWLAPVGTAFPVVDAEPSASWFLLGENGSRDQAEDGVSITHEQTLDLHRFNGSTGPRKATRSEETLRIEVTVNDMRLENYGRALNVEVIEVTPGASTIGTKSIPIYRGFDVDQYALLARGASPYGDWNMQYEVPVVIVDGEPEITYNKTDPAGIVYSFVAMEDPDATNDEDRYGRIIAQSAAATG